MNEELNRQKHNESSDEEDFDARSPRKRRFRKVELEEFCGPVDERGFLKVETFFQDFDWFEPIENILKSVKNHDEEVYDSKADFTLDLSTLELNQVSSFLGFEMKKPSHPN